MKIACYVHPLVHTLGPCFNFAWNEILANILRSLQRDAQCECLLITGKWFTGRTRVPTVRLDEVSLYQNLRAHGERPTALDNAAYQADETHHPALDIIAKEVAGHVSGFVPDIVIAFAGHANYLAKLWPNALRLHTEVGAYARNPYPLTMFFDHLGMHGRSAIGRVGRRILTGPVTTDGRALVSAFRSRMAAALQAHDPFRSHDFRRGFDRLCLLPLNMFNDFSFEAQADYRSQFEYLYDVLSAAPRDVGVIVTEHPGATHVLKRHGPLANVDYLRKTFPNMIFLDEFRSYATSSQFLVPRVDGVWSVSSSIGYQALLFGRALGSPPATQLSSVANSTTFKDFFGRLGNGNSIDADAFLAWQLERYLVPTTLFNDGRWLHDYLRRRLDAARSAVDPIDAFVPTADADRLAEAWIAQAPIPEAKRIVQSVDEADLFRAACELDPLLQSTSWRMTAPLRTIVGGLRMMRKAIKEWPETTASAMKAIITPFTSRAYTWMRGRTTS